ncbi:zinc finger protein ZFP2 isoform X1 [Tachysurus fulvidraco]|uniref:zinc finger protein ZFP2 isoform X1 n=1 Tax=Tachysurus fulvidraco TaxID=1234273 RepID=UPI001FED3D8E|nr:zinc finger protein ZFP2 isoform X1 [Tachysurus fulvidraco]XP_027024805.2 zinc finger protein ZFP2 isoform X1 [Tachysurus fulvidraco]
MAGIKDAYQLIDPVTLSLREESSTSQFYCSSAKGFHPHLSTLVEAFLVEVFRCRVCQFTSSLKTSICSHITESHSSTLSSPLCHNLSCQEKEEEESLTELDQNASPYDLHSGSKNGEDHMDMDRMFLLPMYGILQNISSPPCDISLSANSDSNLHVAQTCEVSTLFDEDRHSDEENVFQLEDSSHGLQGPLSADITCADDEEMAQSAHLMTLGLCRISSAKCPSQPVPLSVPSGGQDVLETSLEDKQPLLTTSETQKQAEEEMGLSCVFCQAVLANHSLLEVHLKCHDGEQGFKCPRCGWAAGDWADMECHWKSHARRKRSKHHKCSFCSRMFRRANLCDAHQKRHNQARTKSSQKQCLLCFKWCRSGQEWEVHQRCHFQGGFKCLYCDFTEKAWKKTYKHILHQHTQTDGDLHHDVSYNVSSSSLKFGAPLTNSYSKRLGDVQVESWRHATKMSEVVEKKKSDKDKKDYATVTEQEISVGLKTPKRKDFCCMLCDKKFSTKLTMRRHMDIHRGEKPYQCLRCHYSTRLKASLIQHMRVHTGEKPYKCPQCPYASIDRSSLRRHSRTHTQEKPYRCQYCPYSCIQKKSLDLHSRRHHTGESFPCPLCQYSTPDRQLLLRHTRKHHTTENTSVLRTRSAPPSKRARKSK